ncbi:MAG TPA: SGNH/GDSL hydrolase family protein [Pyrinomonadaceae bacterium]|jgi:hypothetical protein|nr:SGNH/GDSL hydrolase family protein [Pyrinomonadaceae bacterium]
MKNRPDSIVENGVGPRAGVRASAKILVVLGSLAAGLLLAEAGLRLVGFRYLNLYRDDPEVGYSLRPGAEGWWREEGEAYIRVNSEGLRDREHAKEKPPGTLRVAVVGDSYAEALQVPAEAAFWSVAERRLRGCAALGGREVEFINFGVSGFSTARELLLLRTRVWQYSPDVVLLLVTTGNDVRDNFRAPGGKYKGEALPYFVYREGALVLDDSLLKARAESLKFRLQQTFAGRALDWLRNHSRVVGLFDRARLRFLVAGLDRGDAGRARAGFEPGLSEQVYLEPTDPAWAEAWRVTEGLLLLARDEVRSHGARLLVATGSNGIQVYPDAPARERFARELGAEDLYYPDARIRALGEREGIDVLNLAPALRDYAGRERVFLHGRDGFGHWNALGHRLAGDLLAERLCEATTANR